MCSSISLLTAGIWSATKWPPPASTSKRLGPRRKRRYPRPRAGRPHRHRRSSCKAWGRGSGRAASGWRRGRDTMQARPPWSPCYRAQRCFSIALAGTSCAVHHSRPPCKSVQQQQEWPRRARAIRAYRMSNREKSKSSIGSSPCAAPRTRVFEVDILNDRHHAEYLTDQQRYSMKQQQVEPPKALDPLAALELAAPPGTEYSDAIVAYQIGVFFRANPETLQKRLPGGWKVADQWGPGPRGKLLE